MVDVTQPGAGFWAAQLMKYGFCLIPNLMPASALGKLELHLSEDFEATPFSKGRFYGERTKRFGRLLSRSPVVAELVQHQLIVDVVEKVLSPWCDCIQLNLTQAIAIHPGALAQMPHRDQDMWRGPAGTLEYLVNVMWPLTPFTRENGATRFWRKSHGMAALREEVEGHEVIPEMGPGSALLFLGSTLHAAGANRSDHVRRGVIAGYSLGWLKAYENQFLAYPPAIAKEFDPGLRALIGYRQHRPNLGNFEGRCPSILFEDDLPDRIQAADALRSDQVEAVDAHAAEQRRMSG